MTPPGRCRGEGSAAEHVQGAVLAGSSAVAVIGAVILRLHNATYRRIRQQKTLDADQDCVPDAHEAPQGLNSSPREVLSQATSSE